MNIKNIITKFSIGDNLTRTCQQSSEEMKFLCDTASSIKNGLIFEIGRWYGGSLVLLCLSSPSSKVISLDCATVNNKRVENLLNEYSIDNSRYQILEGTSQAYPWNGEYIDLLFIDGCHETNAVYKDLELWVPKVKNGGLLLMHDMYKKRKGPTIAFNRYLKNHNNLSLVKLVGGLQLAKVIY